MKEKNNEYCVYVHINKEDDYKAYVGITKNVKKRWRNGEGYKGQDKFYNAIKKYGWDKFKHIVLAEGLSLEEAWQKEKEYIIKYDSINDGYNVHEGGKIVLTEEMRQKGYITKKLKESSVTIFNLQTEQFITFKTVAEASEKTGISEHWFYRYYRREVDCLKTLDIRFGIEPHLEITKELQEEINDWHQYNEKLQKHLKEHEAENKHYQAKAMAAKIAAGKW